MTSRTLQGMARVRSFLKGNARARQPNFDYFPLDPGSVGSGETPDIAFRGHPGHYAMLVVDVLVSLRGVLWAYRRGGRFRPTSDHVWARLPVRRLLLRTRRVPRIAVARALGQRSVSALVTEVRLNNPAPACPAPTREAVRSATAADG